MAVAKEQIRQIISENNISSVAYVYTLLKDSFKDILQELMEAELDATLGYEKIIREICRQTIKEMVSRITDKILPQVKEWQSRPLNPVYPFVFMDCIHYRVREDGRILSRAAYVVLGVTVEGYKDILSITVGANETSKFWLGMLNDLKNRGVKDVLCFCVDGLPGFKEAIQAVYPQAEIQRCVIHMLRTSFKYVNYNDLKKFSSDFKAVYNAPNETAALSELENGLPIICKKGKAGMALLQCSPFPLPFYSVGICIIARISRFYSRGRVWAAPTKSNQYNALFVMQKNQNGCIKSYQMVIL